MKNAFSVLLIIALLLSGSLKAIAETDKTTPFVSSVSINGVLQDRVLSLKHEIRLSNDPSQNQLFTLTGENAVVWDNIPPVDNFAWLYFKIYEGTTLSDKTQIHYVQASRGNERSHSFALPALADGIYRFIFFASEEFNVSPFEQYRMPLAVVSGGEIYFAESPLEPGALLAEKLDDAAKAYLADKACYMGISIGIVKNGEVLFLNYGLAEKDGGVPTEHSIYGIGSITKTFTGIILADLAEKGMLSLDDPLDQYLDFVLPRHGDTPLRLMDLLTHTSGLPRDPREWNLPYAITHDMLLECLKEEAPLTKPGDVYHYSNTGFILLGYVIEKVTGKPYEQVIKETILDELAMKSTGIFLTKEQEVLFLPSYFFDKRENTDPFMYDNLWQSAGGLKSSVYDMSRYILANLGHTTQTNAQLQKSLISAQRIHRVVRSDTETSQDRMGLGWRYNPQSWNPYGDGMTNFTVGHSGTGYHTSYLLLAHTIDAGVVILRNNTNNGNDRADDINLGLLAYNLLCVIRDHNG